MKPVCRAGLTSRARIYRRAVHKHLLTKTRHLFNTSFPLVLYRERRILRTYTGMAAARKSPFRNPYERTDHAEEAVPGRRKGSSTSRKRLFGGAEEALRQNGTLSPVMRENAISLSVSALCNTLKIRTEARKAAYQKTGGISGCLSGLFFNISRRVFLIGTTAGRGIEYSEGMTL